MALWNSTRVTTIEEEVGSLIEAQQRHAAAPKKLLSKVDLNLMSEDMVAEYRKVAAEVGISDQDMLVEEFRIFLAKHDIPTFNLGEVVSYMDELAAKDNPTGFGWHWCPVRAKDADIPLTFGRPAERRHNNNGYPEIKISSSDFYESHAFQDWHNHGRSGWMVPSNVDQANWRPPSPPDWRAHPSKAYTRTLPLHALKKVALVEKHFGAGKAAFLVTDYCVAPHVVVNPDPFLMAVIPNSAAAHGKGRFIIDVWDEPGFGIERMLKPA